MRTSEIRQKFLDYFAAHQHTIVPSSSLVPENDPTLLFTNAGMNQFKDVFLGKERRDYKRAASSQKCVRAGGKHNDLENVGFTARHHTFFEMLGNFSFGDYFKKEAIHFAWDFATNHLKLPVEKLYVTVFREDDEAYEIWNKVEKVSENHIFRLGEKDNFWQMGDTGPCGPCTELFIDRGPKYCDGENGKCIAKDHDCDRYMEFWNLVFMQFDRKEDGEMVRLPKPSVDTGAGLERIAAIMQNVDSNYDTDAFQGIIAEIARISGKKYVQGTDNQPYFKVIADHARSVTFLIADGVIPANEGRGYVLRRIIRRAVRYGRELGMSQPFLNQICLYVIEQMKAFFPDLADKKSFVEKCVRAEEEQFFRTLEKGLDLLADELEQVKNKQLSGDVAFKLYDTYGFPFDLTVLIAKEHGINVDAEGFDRAMQKQKDQSRKGRKDDLQTGVVQVYHDLHEHLRKVQSLPKFVGYQFNELESECLGVLAQSAEGSFESVDKVLATTEPQNIQLIFRETPFYAEGGGQVADHGWISSKDVEVEVQQVTKPLEDLIVIQGLLRKGSIVRGQHYLQKINTERRAFIRRNHTATHLLHGALRSILGDHVKQAGSLVNDELLRFDFTHFNALSREEITAIEKKVCEEIWAAHPVDARESTKDEAVAAGAIAFFGEKYGDTVRVIKAGSYSVELCGGTHVSNTSDIQMFKIVSEGAIAAGVRRIVAYTSKRAYEYLDERFNESKRVREIFKAGNADELFGKIERSLENEKQLRQELASMKAAELNKDLEKHIANAMEFAGGKLISFMCPSDGSGMKLLRSVADQVRARIPESVVIIGMNDEQAGKSFLMAAVGKDAKPPVMADHIIRTVAPIFSAKGGGKPDLAQAGGDNMAALPKAMEEARSLVLS